jgi:Zn-dependent protease with chaperone function
MTLWLLALIAGGITLPHALRLTRSAPMAAATLWTVALALRALLVIFAVLYVAFFIPGTEVFTKLTHWCWRTVVPFLAAHLGLDGHYVGGAATILPGLVAMISLLSVAIGVARGTRAVRRLLAGESLGPGPSDTVIVAGHEVMLAAAGLGRPRVVVSAGALLELDDEELAAGLDHERGHIARRHRFVLVFAELCRSIGRAVPGSRHAIRELGFHLERDADRWALRQSHHPYALASAICKAAGTGDTTWARASLSGPSASARLGELIAADDVPPARWRWLLNASAVAMVGLTLLVAALVPSSALAGSQQLGSTVPHYHCDH